MIKEAKLGFFVLLSLVVFCSLIFLLGNFSLGEYYTFSVYFDDVSGLSVKSPIKMSGIKIGMVSDLLLERGEAKVVAKVKNGVVIYKDAVITIASTGVVGSKYLNISKGSNSSEIVKDGDSLIGISPYNFEVILKKVMNVFDGLTGNGDVKKSSIFKTLQNLESITDKINKGIGKDQNDIRDIILNVKEASKAINDSSQRISDLLKNNQSKIQDDINKVGDILASIKIAGDKINTFLDKVNGKDGTIGALVNDEKMASELKSTIESIKDVSKDIKTFTSKAKKVDVFWNTELEYNVKDAQNRTSAGVIIAPKEDKRYIIKANNFSVDNQDKYDKGDQRYNTITFLIEKDFKKFSLSGGIIKSSGGIGSRYKLTDKFGLGAYAYRFNRLTNDGKTIPWIDAFGYYNFTSWGKLKLGLSDSLEKSSLSAGVDISIKDSDVAYLIGLMGLSKLS